MTRTDTRHHQAFPDEEHFGLSKLEYAAIHLLAGYCASGRGVPNKEWAIDQANELFDELDKE